MYGLGEFYAIRSLKWVAAGKFKKLIKPCSPPWSSFLNPDLLAFIQAIEIVYTTTPADDRVLRDSVLYYIPRNLYEMFQVEEFRVLVDGVREFMEDVFSEGLFDEMVRIGMLRNEMKAVKEMCAWRGRGKWPHLEDEGENGSLPDGAGTR